VTHQPPQPRLQRATPTLGKQGSSSSRVASESNNAAAEGSTPQATAESESTLNHA